MKNKVIIFIILIVFSLVTAYFYFTDFKDIDISNETKCRIRLDGITTESGWPTWFTNDVKPDIEEFQSISIRHPGSETKLLIQLNVDGTRHSLHYDAFAASFHPDGDSATPNQGRLHLTNINTPCKL